MPFLILGYLLLPVTFMLSISHFETVVLLILKINLVKSKIVRKFAKQKNESKMKFIMCNSCCMMWKSSAENAVA